MSNKITLQEYEEIEKVREKEIRAILKQACKLLDDGLFLDKNNIDKLLILKHEACISDLKSVFNIIMELKRLRNTIIVNIKNE